MSISSIFGCCSRQIRIENDIEMQSNMNENNACYNPRSKIVAKNVACSVVKGAIIGTLLLASPAAMIAYPNYSDVSFKNDQSIAHLSDHISFLENTLKSGNLSATESKKNREMIFAHTLRIQFLEKSKKAKQQQAFIFTAIPGAVGFAIGTLVVISSKISKFCNSFFCQM